MAELHDAHAGMVKTKSVARMHIWWPNISNDIEQCIGQCAKCQVFKNNPTKAPHYPWETPIWALKGKMWLIMVHALSKWPEMTTTIGENAVDVLRSFFARYDLPKSIVTYNVT